MELRTHPHCQADVVELPLTLDPHRQESLQQNVATHIHETLLNTNVREFRVVVIIAMCSPAIQQQQTD